MNQPIDRLRDEIVVVPDFPQPGISFKDLSGVLANPKTLAITIRAWVEAIGPENPTMIVAVEARGFPLGAALAYELGCGFVPLRRPGRLPREAHRVEYVLEYGASALEIHTDALSNDERVVIIDDVLATGGTACAAIELVRRSGAEVVALGVVMELPALNGRAAVAAQGVHVHALLSED